MTEPQFYMPYCILCLEHTPTPLSLSLHVFECHVEKPFVLKCTKDKCGHVEVLMPKMQQHLSDIHKVETVQEQPIDVFFVSLETVFRQLKKCELCHYKTITEPEMHAHLTAAHF